MRVMIVDDEPFIRQGLKQLIEASKFNYKVVTEAENGFEALEILRSNRVDLIFADIKMPGMTGLELIERIRKENLSDAHIVVLTGFADFEFARKAMRLKVTDYLLKPIQTAELEKIMEMAENRYSAKINDIYVEQKKILLDLMADEKNSDENKLISTIFTKQKAINSLVDEVKKSDEMRKREKKEIGYEVDRYIKEHYRENISLKQIGDLFHVNNVYLGQLLKKRYNMLFKDYINSLRMKDAEDMLLKTNKRIYQISEELGFANVDIFISRFVQMKGITPNQYRLKSRMKNDK